MKFSVIQVMKRYSLQAILGIIQIEHVCVYSLDIIIGYINIREKEKKNYEL